MSLKNYLLFPYLFFQKHKNELKWKRQADKISISLDKKRRIEDEINLHEDEKILIVVPHPDDELIGCYSVIKKFNRKVVLYYSGLTGDDASPENKKVRTEEFANFCDYMNTEYIISRDDAFGDLENILKSQKFKYIFAPSLVDWHNEHRKLFSHSLMGIKGKEIKMFIYQVTIPIPERYIGFYSEMTNREQAEKWKTFEKIYKSQSFMPIARFVVAERVYILKKKKFRAEVFMEYTGEACMKLVHCANWDNMKSEINDLTKVRKSSEKYYKEVFDL